MANSFKVPISVGVDTNQVKKLMERIQGLDKRAGRGAIKKGINELTKKVLWAARGHVPRRSGLLRKALSRKVIIQRGGAKVLGIVKPRSMGWVDIPPNYVQDWNIRVTKSGKTKFWVPKYHGTFEGKKVNPIRYAHLVEFGRVSVVIKQKKTLSNGSVIFGKKVQSVPPHPFMRPAWAENEPLAVPLLHKWLNEALRDYWNKTKYGSRANRRLKR